MTFYLHIFVFIVQESSLIPSFVFTRKTVPQIDFVVLYIAHRVRVRSPVRPSEWMTGAKDYIWDKVFPKIRHGLKLPLKRAPFLCFTLLQLFADRGTNYNLSQHRCEKSKSITKRFQSSGRCKCMRILGKSCANHFIKARFFIGQSSKFPQKYKAQKH